MRCRCVIGWAIVLLTTSARAGEPARDLHLAPLPKGAIARLGVFHESSNAATHCPPSMSPDGKLLASVVNTRVQVWDLATGRVIQNFVAHANPYQFHGLAFVDNDTLFTLGNDGAGFKESFKAWHARTAKQQRTFDVRYDWNNTAFTLSHDGKLLAQRSGGQPQKLHVWDTSAGKELYAEPIDAAQPFFSSDSKFVLTCRQHRLAYQKYDTIVTIRDARAGKPVREIVIKNLQTFITDLSPEGKYLVGHSHIPHEVQDKWRSRLQLFNAESGDLVRTLHEQRSGDPKSAVFSPDGKFVTGVDHTVRSMSVWDVQSGKRVWTLPNGRNYFNYPRFARDGKTLMNTTSYGGVYLHDLATGSTRHLNPTHNGGVIALAFSADGKRLASASYLSEILVWDLASAMPRHRMEMTPAYDGNGKNGWAYAVKLAFAPDDKHLLTQEGDQTVRLFAPERQAEVHAFRAAGHTWGFSDNGKHLLWTGVKLDLLQRMYNAPKQVRADDLDFWLGAARWAVVVSAFPELQQFRARAYTSPELKGDFPPPQRFVFGEATGAAAAPLGLSADGSILVEHILRLAGNPMTGMGTYWVQDSYRLADVATGQEIARLKRNQNPGHLAMLVFAPDSRSFVAVTHGAKAQHGLKLYETRTGKLRLALNADAVQYGNFAFSRDGRWFAFTNGNNAIEIFDLTLGKIAATFAHAESGTRLAFSPDGALLASGGGSGAILLWDLNAVLKRSLDEPAWTQTDKDRLWNDLAHTDAQTAFAAMMKLKRQPHAAVALIRDRLQWHVTNRELEVLIEKLDSNDFIVRKKANDAIEQLGERARPALAKARTRSLEHKRRVDALLGNLERPFATPVGLRLLRAVEVLDGLRTADAASLLRELADDVPPTDPVCRELARALERAPAAK